MATCFVCMENFTNGLPYTITSTAMFALKKDISNNNNNTNFKLAKTDEIWNMLGDEDLFIGKVMHSMVPRRISENF